MRLATYLILINLTEVSFGRRRTKIRLCRASPINYFWTTQLVGSVSFDVWPSVSVLYVLLRALVQLIMACNEHGGGCGGGDDRASAA